ncbi:MAG: RNA methyltransferase [Limnochordaceae bacterium]|nr:RNA methyltransferase [Limnochordaceae bacterium]
MSDSKSSKPFLESPRHPLVQALKQLKEKPAERRRQGRLLIEGRRLIQDALDAGVQVDVILAGEQAGGDPATAELLERARSAGSRVYACGPRVIRALADTEHPQGIVAAVAAREPALPAPEQLEPPVVLVDGVQDPGNVGTIVRTAAAAGARAVVLDLHCADLWNPKVVRASAGAVFRVTAVRLERPGALEELAGRLRRLGWAIMGLDPRGGRRYFDEALTGRAALVVGSEGWGLSEAMEKQCTHLLRIPLEAGVESLNVATATAIVLFEAARQRARALENGGRL